MPLKCEYCGEPALPSDSTCWHCDQPLPGREQKNAEAVTAADTWKGDGKTNVIVAYASMTFLVIVGALVLMGLMGNRPLLQTTIATQQAEAWKSVAPVNDAFFVNLPERWSIWDGAPNNQRAQFDRHIGENKYLALGTHPFGAEIDDIEINFVAHEENSVDGEPGLFFVVASSQKLAALTYNEALDFLSNSDYPVRKASFVDNFDKSNLSIYVDIPLTDEQGEMLRCRQQFILGEMDVMLVAACSPEVRFGGRDHVLQGILESFQRLSR